MLSRASGNSTRRVGMPGRGEGGRGKEQGAGTGGSKQQIDREEEENNTYTKGG